MKEVKILLLAIIMGLFNACSMRKTSKDIYDMYQIDTLSLKKDLLNIVDSFHYTYPQYKSITIYSKFFVDGSEGLCAYSADPFTYYAIGPSAKCMFEQDIFGHKIMYPMFWFKRHEIYVFLQSGQDALLKNESLQTFYQENMEIKITPELFSKCTWIIKTSRDSSCHIISKRAVNFLKVSPEKIFTPLKIE